MSGCFDLGMGVGVVAPTLTDREVLRRLIEYARAEAEGEGEPLCAQLLSAALAALEMSPEEMTDWRYGMVSARALA
ncbi:hypothetical protein [Acuticoccus sp.]|uniref:hypothetical protein n=1 Tax=Acuticoccus sp. TaxID=1904378 RepID=UPI003B528DCE